LRRTNEKNIKKRESKSRKKKELKNEAVQQKIQDRAGVFLSIQGRTKFSTIKNATNVSTTASKDIRS
jgi:hypothetical protein